MKKLIRFLYTAALCLAFALLPTACNAATGGENADMGGGNDVIGENDGDGGNGGSGGNGIGADGNDGAGTEEEEMTDTVYLTVGGRKIAVKLEENAAAAALAELLRAGDITYTAKEYGGFEKVGSLGHALPKSDVRMTTEAGDVILYAGDQIVLFYGRNTWSYTKLGKIQGVSAEEWKSLLTAEDPVSVTISLH